MTSSSTRTRSSAQKEQGVGERRRRRFSSPIVFLFSCMVAFLALLCNTSSQVMVSAADATEASTSKKFVRKSMKDIWLNYNHPHLLYKYIEYADQYDRFLPNPKEDAEQPSVKMMEIGVQSGGSLRGWRQFYGDHAKIVGLDIDKRCKRSENITEHIYIETGSQMDEAFLKSVCEKHGPFDVIIDDGGHTDKMITTSAFYLFPNDQCLKKDGGVYFIEDLHTMVLSRYMKSHGAITEKVLAAGFLGMHHHWNKAFYEEHFSNKLTGIYLFDSMMILTKGDASKHLTEVKRGTDSFDNEEVKLNPEGSYH